MKINQGQESSSPDLASQITAPTTPCNLHSLPDQAPAPAALPRASFAQETALAGP